MATLWVHHAMHALSINDQTDSNASADGHVTKRLLDSWIVFTLRLHVLKHGWHIDICVEENALFPLLTRVELEASGKLRKDREVLPG